MGFPLSVEGYSPSGKLWCGFVVTFLAVGFWRLLSVGTRPWKKNYPPGPPALPIIGNLHQLPKKDVHLTYQKWAKQYGPIFSLKLGQQNVIVLANGDVIKRVIDKKGANYADRQNLYIRELYEDTHTVTRGNTDMWRLERRLYHMNLHINAVEKYIPYQNVETLQLCVDLLKDPEHFFDHIRRTTTSVASSLSYGFRISSADSPVMKQMFKNGAFFFSLANRSRFLDWYPSLRPLFRFLPTAFRPLAREATYHQHEEQAHFQKLFHDANSSRNGKPLMPSFAADISASQKTWMGTPNGTLLTDQAASYVAGLAFEAGADTTKNTLIAFIEAMALFPDVQIKAQKELDHVIGNSRLPSIQDIKELPYIRGVVKESLRWLPTTISGAMPHAAINDDVIDGYDIPAGAGVVLAVWTINNDPDLFPEPRKFEPRRHNVDLRSGEAAQASDINQRDHWTFGAGRRICPGMHLAENTLSLAIARILWAFSVSKAKDENGNEIEIDPAKITQSIAVCPLPFECSIAPRSSDRSELIRKEWAKAQEVLDDEGNYKTSPL